MAKALPIQKVIDFVLKDDHVQTKSGNFYFYRYTPPNMSLLTELEIEQEIENYAQFLNRLNRPTTMFVTDKIENFDAIKNYYSSLDPKYEYMTSEIVAGLENSEVKSTSVQRAFYFVFKQTENDDVLSIMTGAGMNVVLADKAELTVLMRNYYVREFVNKEIYTIDQEAKKVVNSKRSSMKGRELAYNREILRALTPHRMDFNIFNGDQGNTLRKTIMVKNFPGDIPPMALMEAACLSGTTFTMRLEPMNRAHATKMVDKQIKNQSVKGGRNNATEKINASEEQQRTVNFYKEIARSLSVVYHINVFIEFYSKDKKQLQEKMVEVTDILGGASITYEELKYEQRMAFDSVQPLGRDHFLADSNNMPSTTVAALYPASFSCRLDPQGMYLGKTEQGGRFFIDQWVRNQSITNGNYVVLGTSGQGKSYLLKKIITFQHMRGTSCFILDPDNEYIDLVTELKGTVINCSDGKVKINPFEVRRLKSRVDEEEDGTVLDDGLEDVGTDASVLWQHLSWLNDFFSVLFPSMDTIRLKSLMLCVQEMYREHGMTDNVKYSYSEFGHGA